MEAVGKSNAWKRKVSEMNRKLAVVLPALNDCYREQILAAARRHGFSVSFFTNDQDALPALSDAEVILGQSAFLSRNAPKLRWLCTPSAGVNQFLAPDAFAAPDAMLSNSSGAYGVTIAEHIVMVTLELMRRQMEYNEIVSRRAWRRDLPIRSIHGSRVTLLGTGDIGREAAVRLRAFSPQSLTGMNRSGRNPENLFDRIVTEENLDAVLPETDLLILSLPDTPETRGILSAKRLSLLPRDAFLVNVGRGTAIDQQALEALLRAGHLAGAALDVFEKEPLPADSGLWECPCLLVTPHVAGNMTLAYTVDRIIAQFLADFERYCAGLAPAHLVDRSIGY